MDGWMHTLMDIWRAQSNKENEKLLRLANTLVVFQSILIIIIIIPLEMLPPYTTKCLPMCCRCHSFGRHLPVKLYIGMEAPIPITNNSSVV